MSTWRTSKATTLTAATAASLLALTACGNGDDDNGEADGDTLQIALFGEEPYSWLDDDGEPTGATIAVAEEIFEERMGYELEVEETDWDNLIPGLTSENWDVVSAGMSINPERCAEAAFGEPELVYTTALLVEEGNPAGVEDFDDLLAAQEDGDDLDVVALSAGVEMGWLEEMGIDAEGVANAQDGIDFVEGGRADVFALTAISLEAMAGDMDGLEVTDAFSHEISVGAHTFRPEDTELIEEFNEHLAELKESGEYLDIVSEFGFTEAEIPDPEMTTEELCEGDIDALNEKYLED
ncbi:transporter substrate-binding domain-containing protein [Nesterenkonia aerolata]|uniref:Transporter substrate-binding domain-containing protein n=1 Tax=Nesterenkonia aerolata TaxID=3074079 RepID=A0ABU2DP93_9MICC|nr:transporter substrate-binding domain-containing protein [Nesterenkonia sp. LY-0111]MDR8018324.1 transporter substrate-binding domain-containing protein [Nesterenkonia sp. LY-0111]